MTSAVDAHLTHLVLRSRALKKDREKDWTSHSADLAAWVYAERYLIRES